MRTRILIFVVAASIAYPSGVLAQAAPTAGAMITPDQRAAIRKHIVEEKRPPVAAPPGFEAVVGAAVPTDIALFWMPPGAGVNRYRYTIIGNRTLILDPEDRRIIELVE